MLKIALLTIACFSVSACIQNSDANQSYDISYSVSSSGVQTGIDSQQTHVIRNANEYSNLMSSVQLAGVIPNPDFSQSMVVGVFSTLTSCYSQSVATVQDIDGSIVITTHISGDNVAACNPVIGSKYIFIELAQSSKQVSVVFKWI